MKIDKSWTVLTVGDGDLSFSRAIFDHFKPAHLTATVYDSAIELTKKYGSEHLDYLQQQALTHKQCHIMTGFDVTDPQCMQKLSKQYDLVIFQFPLVPNFANVTQFQQNTQINNAQLSINTLNRRLLSLFLLNSFEFLLSQSGAQLAYISSKDVKPYIEWDIEYALTKGSELTCIGSMPFQLSQFPGYKIRNVDRDKHVKDTAAYTYVYSTLSNQAQIKSLLPALTPTQTLFGEKGCDICHAGPFETEQEKTAHLAGKKHKRMSGFDKLWYEYLEGEYIICRNKNDLVKGHFS